jgi:CHAT domain-containing protein
MSVSRRVSYEWTCPTCGLSQVSPVWRLLDARERSDILEELSPGLAHVLCSNCEEPAAIDAPLLLIRPGNELSLMLALPHSELLEESPPSTANLLQEAQAALGSDTEGVSGPSIPIPRSLLLVALRRNVAVDATDPEQASREISEYGPVMAGWYREFLGLIRGTEPERKLRRALQELWNVPPEPEEFGRFLQQRPELASDAAVALVSAELAAGPPPGESDAPLRARLRLVQALAAGLPPAEAAADYLNDISSLWPGLARRVEELLHDAENSPGSDAIPFLREALGIATAAGHQQLEALVAAELGVSLLSQGGVDVLEEAIALLSRSLTLTPEEADNWPEIAGNLATGYTQRITGDSIENWSKAQDLLERACAASDRSRNPRTWAITHTNLGYLLAERPGRTVEDLTRAIELVQEGLEERSPQREPVDWGYSQLNLGLLHQRRNGQGDLRYATDCYRNALEHLQAEDDQRLWTTLQNNLADARLNAQPPDIAGAEQATNAALAVANEDADPLTTGRLLWLVARIADHRIGPVASEAIRARRRALELLNPRLAPELHMRIGDELVDAYQQLHQWEAAADTYEGMLTAHDSLYNAQTSPEGRRRVLTLGSNLARWAAFAFARVGRLEQAVEALEQGRARQLSVSASRDTVELSRLAAVDRLLADQWLAALAEYRSALVQNDSTLHSANTTSRVSAAEEHVRHLLEQIHTVPGFEDFLRSMTAFDICQAGGRLPVIYLLNAPQGSYVLTVTQGPSGQALVDSVEVAEVSSRNILHLAIFDVDNPNAPSLLLAQSANLIRRRQLLPVAMKRLIEIQPLIEPIARTLATQPEHSAVVIPTGLLGLVPLQAVPSGAAGEVLDDIGEVRLAPSAAVYAASTRRAREPRQQHLVGVADTDPTNPLLGSQAEVASIQELFSPSSADCAIASQATRSWLLDYIPLASHLHLACHGRSDLTGPLGGALRLAGEEELTIDDLLDGRLRNCRLAVASACQSGHFATSDSPDEFTGLPAGFLQAGAACAIVSLWQVDDHATALMMTRLYELLDPNLNTVEQKPAAALRAARTWLRGLTAEQAAEYVRNRPAFADVLRRFHTGRTRAPALSSSDRPYASPIYWATFVAYGV